MIRRHLYILIALAAVTPTSALAHGKRIPAFARKYGISCSVCHAPVPKLTPAGEAFAANGFEFEPGEEPRDTIATGDPLLRLQRSLPLAVRVDAYSTLLSKTRSGEVSNDFQAPWVIKLLSGGQIANKVSYYTYFLLAERGEVAGLEDAYLQFTDVAKSGVSLIVGQFQVSDPLFKRELRLTYEDYQPYRVRVGTAVADLTYDRGLMALWSPWEGGDFTGSVVSGNGLSKANDQRQLDGDNSKNFALRYSHDLGHVRLGVFGYTGLERRNAHDNRINVWGPDGTLTLGQHGEINIQYLERRDRDPFYGACSVAAPCPGGKTQPFGTTVRSGFAEAVMAPQGAAGRVFITGLYNWVQADGPVVSLRLGEQSTAPGYLTDYRTVDVGLHYLYRRNLRLLGETSWDLVREQGRLVLGLMAAF